MPLHLTSITRLALHREVGGRLLQSLAPRLTPALATPQMSDPYHLQRFVEAQSDVYRDVLSELRSGRKTSHWMWFIFPQIKGLGHSATAQFFAIASLEEAQAYLAHALLGSRLRDCTALVNQIQQKSIEQIFGFPDHLKFRSSMTLFQLASVQPVAEALAREQNESSASPRAFPAAHALFSAALEKYFRGEPDPQTLALLKS